MYRGLPWGRCLAPILTLAVMSLAEAETTFVDIDLVPTGTMTGNVTRESASVRRNTIVYVQGTSYVGITDDVGDYTIEDVPVGIHELTASGPAGTTQTIVSFGGVAS